MDSKEAKGYIKGVRDYRKEIGKPLHDPSSEPEQRQSALEDLRALRVLHREDPDYRQSLRIISELRSQREVKPSNEPDLKKAEHEFPTDPEERFATILSSVGNNAGKQITFLSIPSVSGTIITPWELHTAFIANSNSVWKRGSDVSQAHTEHSLIPIGMVAKKEGFKSGMQEVAVGFIQTEAGKKYGDPIAKYLLKYASEHNLSLEKILGTTASRTGSRAPYNRARVLEYLVGRKDATSIKIAQIAKDLGFQDPTTISESLTFLQNEGLVVYDSVNTENTKGKFTFSLNPEFKGEVKKSRSGLNVTPIIQALYLFANRQLTILR